MPVTTEQISALGLAGVPRAAPLWQESSGSERPDEGYTELALSGTPGGLRQIDPKGSGTTPPRPDDWFTELGLTGVSAGARTIEAKPPIRGIRGSVSLTFTPSATMYRAPRYYTTTNLVLSIRPMGAQITVAHTNRVAGSISLQIRAQATQLRYHREGQEFSLQGNNTVEVAPFGFMTHRSWRRFAGSTPLTFSPQAKLTYTPAPVRQHRVLGSTRTTITPQGVMQHAEIGLAYSFSGTSSFSVQPRGRVSVIREATYAVHGRVSLRFVPQATLEKTTGEPVAYHISGSTVVSFIPQGSMGIQDGLIEQHAIMGHITFGVVPQARVRYEPAPTFDPLAPGERRRLVRIFR